MHEAGAQRSKGFRHTLRVLEGVGGGGGSSVIFFQFFVFFISRRSIFCGVSLFCSEEKKRPVLSRLGASEGGRVGYARLYKAT